MIDPIEIRPNAKAANFKTIRLMYRARKQVVLRIVDEEGRPVPLAQEPENLPAPKPQFGYQKPVGPTSVTVKLVVSSGNRCTSGTSDRGISGFTSDNAGSASMPIFEKTGTIIEGSQPGECEDCVGLVEFLFEDTDCIGPPGIYLCQVERYVTGGHFVDATPAYLYIEPNLRYQHQQSGAPTIPEIRLHLGDSEINEVSLLDTFEFTDTEIADCMRRVVDHWNQTPPPVQTYNYDNYPFKYWWIKGTMIELLKIAARRYARNRLQYSAGGVNIDDQNKANDYIAMANDMKQEYMDWFKAAKVGQNMARAWSSVPISGMRSRGF